LGAQHMCVRNVRGWSKPASHVFILIVTARVFFKQFINALKPDTTRCTFSIVTQFGNFAHFVVYGFGRSNSSALRALEGAYLEEQQSTITPEVAASVFEVAPYLAPRPVYHPPPVPTNPRDVEIYRLHEVPTFFGGTEAMRMIPTLAEEFGLKEKSVWGICTKMRKRCVTALD